MNRQRSDSEQKRLENDPETTIHYDKCHNRWSLVKIFFLLTNPFVLLLLTYWRNVGKTRMEDVHKRKGGKQM